MGSYLILSRIICTVAGGYLKKWHCAVFLLTQHGDCNCLTRTRGQTTFDPIINYIPWSELSEAVSFVVTFDQYAMGHHGSGQQRPKLHCKVNLPERPMITFDIVSALKSSWLVHWPWVKQVYYQYYHYKLVKYWYYHILSILSLQVYHQYYQYYHYKLVDLVGKMSQLTGRIHRSLMPK